jgi:hypothetical protein
MKGLRLDRIGEENGLKYYEPIPEQIWLADLE